MRTEPSGAAGRRHDALAVRITAVAVIALLVPSAATWLMGSRRPAFLDRWFGPNRIAHPHLRTLSLCFVLYALTGLTSGTRIRRWSDGIGETDQRAEQFSIALLDRERFGQRGPAHHDGSQLADFRMNAEFTHDASPLNDARR